MEFNDSLGLILICVVGFLAMFFPIAVVSMRHLNKLQKTGRVETKNWIYTATRRNPADG